VINDSENLPPRISARMPALRSSIFSITCEQRMKLCQPMLAGEKLFLVKLSLDEGLQFDNGGGGIRAFDMERNFAAGAGGEHH